MNEIVEGNPLWILYLTFGISFISVLLSGVSLYFQSKERKKARYTEVKKSLLGFPILISEKHSPSDLLLNLRLIFEEINSLEYVEHKKKLYLIAIKYFFNLQKMTCSDGEQSDFDSAMQITIDSDPLVDQLFRLEPSQGMLKKLSIDNRHEFLNNGIFKQFIFDECLLHDVDFSKSKFMEVNFNNCSLENMSFVNTEIEKINFEGTNINKVYFTKEQLKFFSKNDYDIKQKGENKYLVSSTNEISNLVDTNAENTTDTENIFKKEFSKSKINQKLYSTSRYIFNNVETCKNSLEKDLKDKKINKIYIKESANYSKIENEYGSWYSFLPELIKDSSVFYFIIKNKESEKNSIVFRFQGENMKSELIGNNKPDVNGVYSIYIAKKKEDNLFVNDRIKQNPVYISDANLVYNGSNK